MNPKRTIDRLLVAVRADPTDTHSRLRLGDLYAKLDDIPNALAMYEEVAKYYAHEGLSLKALTVYKHMCSMITANAPELRHRYAHVPPIMSQLFQQLGLNDQGVTALDALAAHEEHGPS